MTTSSPKLVVYSSSIAGKARARGYMEKGGWCGERLSLEDEAGG